MSENNQPKHLADKQSIQHKRHRSDSNDHQSIPRSRSRSRDKNQMANKKDKQQQIPKIVNQKQINNNGDDSDFDMFADEPQQTLKQNKDKNIQNGLKQIILTDQTGYYMPVVGTVIGKKYKIVQKLGKGVFGNVIKVEDLDDLNKIYAIKLLRKNELTRASGYRQYKILSQIHEKRKLKRIMKVYDIFEEQGHLCIVCELLSMDLRSFSHKVQPTLADIRVYAIGMILISHELRLSKVIHADIKPDNFLFKESMDPKLKQSLNERTIIDNLKLADFGTSFFVEEYNSSAEEQVARYYRAPQIILGTQIKQSQVYAIDIWAMGCSLFELYTNQFLFDGSSNNDMLRLMMQTKGKFNIKMLNKSEFKEKHFDGDFNFLYHTIDKVSKQPKIQKIQVTITGQRDLMNMLKKHAKNQNMKQLQNFKDFLERCLALNPKDRITPAQAIQHPFLHFQTKLQN